jgi:hypothetical protein
VGGTRIAFTRARPPNRRKKMENPKLKPEEFAAQIVKVVMKDNLKPHM